MHSGLAVTAALGEAEQNRVIQLLVDVAAAAFHLCDNTENDGETRTVTDYDFDALSDALDKLDELPDDQPGYVMEGPAKAAWALRALLERTAGVRVEGGNDGD